MPADRSGPRAPRALTRYADGQGGGFFWSADSQRVYFPRQGDLWQVPVERRRAAAVWTTPQTESGITPSPDGTRVAFVRSAMAPAWEPRPSAGRGGRGGGAGGGDLSFARSPTDGVGRAPRRGRRSAASAGRPTAQCDRVHRRRAHDPSRADAGVLGREDHLHHQRERARARRCVVAGGRWRADIARLGRRIRRRAAGSTRGTFSSIAPRADFKRRTTLASRISRAASRKCCTRTSRRSSGA